MTQKKIIALAKEMFYGKPEIRIDGWSLNGSGKWTAELFVDGDLKATGQDDTKRHATEALLEEVERMAEHARKDG